MSLRSISRIVIDESRRPTAWVWAALWFMVGVMLVIAHQRGAFL